MKKQDTVAQENVQTFIEIFYELKIQNALYNTHDVWIKGFCGRCPDTFVSNCTCLTTQSKS